MKAAMIVIHDALVHRLNWHYY